MSTGEDPAAEVRRLRAGEDDTPYAEGTVPTPGQWIARWNSLSGAERLDLATRVLESGQAASECFLNDHKGRVAEAEHWRRRADLVIDYETRLARAGLLPKAIDAEVVQTPGLVGDMCAVKFTMQVPAGLETEGRAWLEEWAAHFMAVLPPFPAARDGKWTTGPQAGEGEEVR